MEIHNGDGSAKPRVALLGTGIMGAGMAERLLDQGFSVDVWDRSPATALRLEQRGATAHREPAEAAHVADIVITTLPTGDVVSDVMLRQDAVGAMRPNGIWAQMGTIGIQAIDQLIEAVSSRRPDIAL